MKNKHLRTWIVSIGLCAILCGIAAIFWYNEWVYNLPTPIPANYHSVDVGERVALNKKITNQEEKPLFLHFYNPECPCSRFNVSHFKSLVQQYGDKVAFAIVVMREDEDYTKEEILSSFGLDLPVYFDNAIAKTCGVYSTPQAVILDADQKLYYRGNYNITRYCTNKKTAFAQLALDSLLNNNSKPVFDELALKAYGCQIPKCTLK
ncbi:TlpA family protein disulfide reductase [Solitalea lacus]|uniref:TlpA family protein disulfide reductase n=1 Tax=Solitalea lacus TaxID=2911172 RepID=UPI001EDBA1E4|nr:thioredoxin fold domain-containing protein [Solitalea lacus]UKJ07897.1 AhpC/TSA family protein [Solitalea lacus]